MEDNLYIDIEYFDGMSDWDLLSSEVYCRDYFVETYMYLFSCSISETVLTEDLFSILCLTTDVSTKVMRKKSVTSARSPRNTSVQPGDR